ncbi:MAG TPA: hypothetical protein VD973_06515 [Symbiobacteriaceae bacterium]|jgi:hypothetical protein|nr:hypothetical protein [Symbiobacteriaceae bacterium]
MSRKWLALLLVALGGFGLLPYLQNAVALSEGSVRGHSTDRSKYTVTAMASNNQLVACRGGTITVQRAKSVQGAMFRCWTNYDAPVTLQWELADPNNPLLLSVATPTTVTLQNTDTAAAQCRMASVTARNLVNDTTGTVILRGKTTSTSDFYVEINFPVTVTVQKGGSGVGFTCP